jgi:hypothetical protein
MSILADQLRDELRVALVKAGFRHITYTLTETPDHLHIQWGEGTTLVSSGCHKEPIELGTYCLRAFAQACAVKAARNRPQ